MWGWGLGFFLNVGLCTGAKRIQGPPPPPHPVALRPLFDLIGFTVLPGTLSRFRHRSAAELGDAQRLHIEKAEPRHLQGSGGTKQEKASERSDVTMASEDSSK